MSCSVKAEIHGSEETTTIQEQSDSDSGAEATRRDHHYEDIYLPRDEPSSCHQRRRYDTNMIKFKNIFS